MNNFVDFSKLISQIHQISGSRYNLSSCRVWNHGLMNFAQKKNQITSRVDKFWWRSLQTTDSVSQTTLI